MDKDLWDTLSSQASIEVETNCCDDVYLSVLFMILQIKDHIFQPSFRRRQDDRQIHVLRIKDTNEKD